ncbi:MAG: hypothetical protein ACD_51C00327G0007 [uncultured bacterium]|nr:MAG: hypothetical protein ACD_51C00327G0007 [uncultured bacterium]
MQIRNLIKKNTDLILILLAGIILLVISEIEILYPARWILGMIFVFSLSGYPMSVVFFPIRNSIDKSERLLMSVGFSLLLTYPAGLITVLLEGKSGEAIYGPHLMHSLGALTGLVFATIVIAWMRRSKIHPASSSSSLMPSASSLLPSVILLFVILISIFFNFANLNRADLHGDEYDMGYVAYDLIDGTVAGRNGFMLSTMGHTPLAMFINHFSMQILENEGFQNIQDWMIRFACAITGVLCVLALYMLGKEIFNEKIGLLAALLLAVSNYHVWTSRIFLREVFMTFFIILTIFFLFRLLKNGGVKYAIITGIFFGALLLTKMTGIFLAPVLFLWIILYGKEFKIKKNLALFTTAFLMFLPVIIYNIGGYVMTGYMDIFFSRIFGLYHPYGYTGDRSHTAGVSLYSDLKGIFELLIDQYSIWLFALFFAPIAYALARIKKTLKEPNIVFQMLLTITILGFFALSGVRAYYMPFLTVPLALVASCFLIQVCKNKYLKIPTVLIFATTIFYASFYTYNTNISSAYAVDSKWNDSGRTGYVELVPQPLTYHYSRSARVWSENRGWKNLEIFLSGNITREDLLIIDDDLDSQMINQYLDINEYTKEFYLGSAYIERYENIFLSEFLVDPQAGYIITVAEKTFDYELITTINDIAGNPRFNIYEVSD